MDLNTYFMNHDDVRSGDFKPLRYAPLEQLALSPQCGFSSTVHGNDIAVEAQRAKLRLVVETAREGGGELGAAASPRPGLDLAGEAAQRARWPAATGRVGSATGLVG